MKKLLLLSITLLFASYVSAQCGTCTPDTDCVLSPAYPTICPNAFPDATTGVAYEADMSFYTPYEFYDPGNGVDVEFQQVLVTGVTGLPFGMSIELNEPSGTYIPSQNEHGCARLCGTPISPGNYSININFVATVFVPSIGITVAQPDAFQLSLTVLEGEGGNINFTYGPATGCDSALVTFEGLLNASPNPTTYAWDFGNGNTSDQQFPPVQLFGDTGTYTVSLLTQFEQFVITQINVSSVNDNWCGDAEEATCTGLFGILPDIFVQVKDANGTLLYQSGSTGNTLTGSWTGLEVVANNGPFTVQVWDEDAVSTNDDLGTFSFTISGTGNISFSGAGGTSGFIVVDTQVSDSFYNEEVITVFPAPSPTLDYDTESSTLIVNEPSAVNYVWYFNDLPIDGATNSEYEDPSPGVYYVVVQNAFGCTGISNEIIVCPDVEVQYNSSAGIVSVSGNYESYQWYYNGEIIEGATNAFYPIVDFGLYSVNITTSYGCDFISEETLVCPTVTITLDPETGLLTVPTGFTSYQWVRNGVPISGANSNTTPMSQTGNYWVVVTTDYGCNISSGIFISTVGVEETEGQSDFSLFPNPAQNGFNLRHINAKAGNYTIYLVDDAGRIVQNYGSFNQSNLNHQWFGVDNLSRGFYSVVVEMGEEKHMMKLLLQ